MIRNRYNYPTPSEQDTKGKEEGRTESNGTTIKTQQAESQRTVSFPQKMANILFKNKNKLNQDIHAKIHNDRNNKPHQKYRLGMVSKKYYGGLNRVYVATILALRSAVVYTSN